MVFFYAMFIYVLMLFIQLNQAALTFEFDEDFRDCENGLPMPGLDTTNFQVILEDDGSVTLNGTVQFTKDYNSPIRMKLYTKRHQQGEWNPGMFSREIQNLCPVLQMPHELWYPYTRVLQQKTCPFREGHEEHMNNVNIGNLGAKFNVPQDFVGEWRFYYEFTTTRKGKSVPECLLIPVTISEV